MKSIIILASSLFVLNAFADISTLLPRNDELGKVAKAIGIYLNDGNISTGSTLLWAGKLKSEYNKVYNKNLGDLVRTGVMQAYKNDHNEALPADSKFEIDVGTFRDGDSKNGDVYRMTSAIMESNDYDTDNQDIRENQARHLWAVLRKLPVRESTIIGHATVMVKEEDWDSPRRIQYYLLIKSDKKLVQLFTIEGTM